MSILQFPDGELELGWSGTALPPNATTPPGQPRRPTAWYRLDGGPWRPIPGEQSAYAASGRIDHARTRAEALSILLSS